MQKSLICFLLLIVHSGTANSQTTQQWARSYGSATGGISSIAGVETDRFDNVYVCATKISNVLTDIVLIKYSSSGNEEWVRSFAGTLEERAVDLVVDRNDNIIVTGLTENQTGTYDIVTVKYSPSGDILWTRIYDAPGTNVMDQPVAMAIDAADNVYVSGYSFGTIPLTIVTLKYSPQGDSLWVNKFVNSGTDYPLDILVDSTGNSYVYSRGTRVLKYNTNGNLVWNRVYPFNSAESKHSVTMDPTGNIFFICEKNTTTFGDFAVVKINSSNGDTIWSRVRNGNGILPSHDYSNAVCTDSDGSVYLTGLIYVTSGTNIFTTMKWNNNGDFEWEKTYTHPQNGGGGNDIVCDKQSNVYVIGGTNSFCTFKYSSAGDSILSHFYNSPSNMSDLGEGIALDNSGNLIVTGRSRYGLSPLRYEVSTVKYTEGLTLVSLQNEQLEDYRFYQNYPNPFNSSTVFRYDLKRDGNVKLLIYDAQGKIQDKLVQQFQNAGNYTIIWNADKYPSGIYFAGFEFVNPEYRVTESRKIFFIK